MKNLSNIVKNLIFILSIALVVKIIYLIISYRFLPTNGIELSKKVKLKGLSYSYKLAHKQSIKATPKPKSTPKPIKKITMKGYKLIGLMSFGEKATIIVQKGSKTHVISIGMEIDGFKLIRVEEDSAIFEKNGQEFKLSMTSKIENPASAKKLNNLSKVVRRNSRSREEVKESDNEFGIEKREDVTVIPKNLLSSYTKDIDKIWQSIGLGEHRNGGKLDGFTVNYIKKDSVFEYIGLKKGDILKSVNGEELDGYNTAFNIFKDIDNIEELTITVLRDNKVMELEYEIH